MILNIQRFSTHDGEGIRTVIFYKGCPLACQWCSNPESQSTECDIMYDQKMCQQFEYCTTLFPEAISSVNGQGVQIRREDIIEPEQLKDRCFSKALVIAGESKSPVELLKEVEKDLPFYRKQGGVTLSGGEPLSQNGELLQLLKLLKSREINVDVETCLHVQWENIEQCLGYVDTFLVDVKHVDGEKFLTYVDGDVNLVIENLNRLAGTGANVIARIPVIPGFNHNSQDMRKIIDFIAGIPSIHEIHLLPYHSFGVEKYKMLGKEYAFGNFPQVLDDELDPYLRYAQSKGLITRIGG